MRKFKLLLISVLFPCMCMGEGAYHEDNEFIIRAGFTGSHLRYKDNIGGTVNVSYIPFEINSCGIGWNANFTKTKDYYSISPLGATATLLTFLQCRQRWIVGFGLYCFVWPQKVWDCIFPLGKILSYSPIGVY